MNTNLEEVKMYLRVDHKDEDELIESFIRIAETLCKNALRDDELVINDAHKVAIMYVVAYLYEHRENANYTEVLLNLRAMFQDDRKDVF